MIVLLLPRLVKRLSTRIYNFTQLQHFSVDVQVGFEPSVFCERSFDWPKNKHQVHLTFIWLLGSYLPYSSLENVLFCKFPVWGSPENGFILCFSWWVLANVLKSLTLSLSDPWKNFLYKQTDIVERQLCLKHFTTAMMSVYIDVIYWRHWVPTTHMYQLFFIRRIIQKVAGNKEKKPSGY